MKKPSKLNIARREMHHARANENHMRKENLRLRQQINNLRGTLIGAERIFKDLHSDGIEFDFSDITNAIINTKGDAI